MEMTEDTIWINATQAAALHGVSRQAVDLWIRQGRIAAQRVGRYWFLRRSDVEAYAPVRGAYRRQEVSDDNRLDTVDDHDRPSTANHDEPGADCSLA